MRQRWWIVPAVAGAVYAVVAGCVMWSSDAPVAGGSAVLDEPAAAAEPVAAGGMYRGLPYRGFAMQVQRIDNVADYGRCVDRIAALGADTVLFVVDSRQENGQSTRIFLDMRAEPTPEKLGELVDYAHQKKLRVILMPLVLLDAPINNEWRGTIQPAVWEDWWDSYRDMLDHYAGVAERHHVEMFVVGSELVSTEHMLDEWTRTIRQVRSEYHGRLTYSANWDHYSTIPFWNQLDVMGMNSYYKLGDNANVTVADIDRRWKDIRSAILKFGHKINRPVVMLEVGWCSMANAASEPWDYTQTTVPLDLELQKRLYQAYFETWYGQKGFGGFMLWAWTPNASGPEDRGYTPEGKPAEQVVRDWFAKAPWKVD